MEGEREGREEEGGREGEDQHTCSEHGTCDTSKMCRVLE